MRVFERSSPLNRCVPGFVHLQCLRRIGFSLQLRKPPFKNQGYAGVKMLRGFVLSITFLVRFDHLPPFTTYP